jgi:hypothetical protein
MHVDFTLIPKSAIRSTQRKPAHIAISANGRFCLSTAAVEYLKGTEVYQYAFLLWAEKDRVIAIKPTKHKDERAYRIIPSSSGKNAAIAAKGFCELIGYDFSQHKSFAAHWNEAESRFEIQLDSVRKPKTIPITESIVRADDIDDLVLWIGRDEVCRKLRIAKRTLQRLVHDGDIKRRWRTHSGRRGEPVYDPRDVDKIAKSSRTA